ncbi:hypothetical protein AYI69_g7021 [Smittium culicis]|uniref:Uncharacterized protein n=1 Tax=Smittium culicis TaxID=133412 RepID=A0A1R1XUX3_9FUNG|nr:hypothetical protein AYI69_g10630 [Smittium culicis]OMJ18442.1 hypothetical protein AYI69_g7021 [Smittium culicis]
MRRVRNRTLHLVHGEDVATAIIEGPFKTFTPGQRWIVSDYTIYDMLEILAKNMVGEARELLQKTLRLKEAQDYINSPDLDKLVFGEKANLVRRLDPSDFWVKFNLNPTHKFSP